MPVQLEWEIEDVETPLPPTDGNEKGGSRTAQRWWRFGLVVMLVLAAAAGYLGFRISDKRKELETEIRGAARLELSALVNGDKDLFLSRQDPDDQRWRRAQERVFDDYQIPAMTQQFPWDAKVLQPYFTGEVSTVRVQPNRTEAEVEVEVALGEQSWRQLWLYGWSAEDGWRHRRLDKEWAGESQRLVTQHFSLSFTEREEAAATALAHTMEGWYERLARAFDLAPTSRVVLAVEFAFRTLGRSITPTVKWEAGRYNVGLPLIHQGMFSPGGEPTADLQRELARYLVTAMMAQKSGLEPASRLAPVTEALRDEIQDWAVAQLAPEEPVAEGWMLYPTPLVDALVSRDGEEVLAALLEKLADSLTLDQILIAAGVEPPDVSITMAFYAAAVGRSLHNADARAFDSLLDPQADRAWREYHQEQQIRARREPGDGILKLPPASLKVRSVAFHEDKAWVVVDSLDVDGVTRRTARFFRRQDGIWLMTSPDHAFFGETRERHTENLLFRYFERDAPWFEGELPDALQSLLHQAAVDLGITMDDQVFTVTTRLETGLDGLAEPTQTLNFTSPILAGWPTDRSDEPVVRVGVPLAVALLQREFAGILEDAEEPNAFIYVSAFIWELNHLFADQVDIDSMLGIEFNETPVVALAELWLDTDSSLDEADFERMLVSYRTLFEHLAEVYGPQVVPSLLRNLDAAQGMDDWLRRATGDGLTQIEPGWQAWLSSRLPDD